MCTLGVVGYQLVINADDGGKRWRSRALAFNYLKYLRLLTSLGLYFDSLSIISGGGGGVESCFLVLPIVLVSTMAVFALRRSKRYGLLSYMCDGIQREESEGL